MNSRNGKISWSQFTALNEDITSSFEGLCRLLFKKQFFNNDTNFASKPNHPGVEIFPVLEPESGKKISFQAKFFFTSTSMYSQIKHSIQETIKYYADDLDIFYLYCNKDMNPDTKGYKECKNLLNSVGIELQVITNNEILDQVIENPRLGEYFFGQESLNDEWFKEQLEKSLDVMGTRYNKLFNVASDTEREFKLFLKNLEALKIIESKKQDIIEELHILRRSLSGEPDKLAREMISKICSYQMDSIDKIEESFCWADNLRDIFHNEFELVIAEIKNINTTKAVNDHERQENQNKTFRLERLLNISTMLEFSEIERNLIEKKILIINGKAGQGKSQLLSESANEVIETGGHAILLPSHVFLSSQPVQAQILSYLGLNVSFRELLDILETIGELNNEKIYIFIDAINESNNKEIWKAGLSAIFQDIDRLDFVKVAVSFRSGYENSVLDESIKRKIGRNEIPKITHYGLQNNSTEAIREFLNYYNVPFLPSYLFQSEMTNPLLLKMFCETYDGDEFDIYHVLEKFLEKADFEAQRLAGLPGERLILNNLIREIADFHLKNEVSSVSEHDLLEMNFWNHYGVVNKFNYLSSLTKSGIFLTFMRENEEEYRFGYNLFEDFMYARVIIDRFSSAEECKEYLHNDLLKVNDDEQVNWRYQDTFIVVTSLFFAKFGEECIDIADDIRDDFDRNRIFDEFAKSFSWRSSQNTDSEFFRNFINERQIDRDTVFSVLIENSTKKDSPLNAEFLHEILVKVPLNKRDYLWTTYVSDLGYEEDRVLQLISLFDKGEKLDNSRENTWLLLVLFSWLLTSSNRMLRDRASKAMIEILKNSFDFCLPLLKKFEDVNDPYVIQRLYGVIFGACTKNINLAEVEFCELAEYVYLTIFDKESVYPDILLRDYAKLIIEYFLFKFPDNETTIKEERIKPPYNSEPIPIADKAKDTYTDGLNLIAYSMAPEGVEGRTYGDFGRYVFDVSLHYFSDVDSVNIYNYAMDFIENTLGYENELFSENDSFRNRHAYSRHDTNKVERIGKKYEWIAMYNILARISDHHELSDRYNEGDDFAKFDGAWNPYVRDFDPTLNRNFLNDPNYPLFKKSEPRDIDFIARESSQDEVKKWVEDKDDEFFTRNINLVVTDVSENEWVALDYYVSERNDRDEDEELRFGERVGIQNKWIMAKGYFICKSEFKVLKDDLADKSFWGGWFPEGNQSTYWLYNREFGWSTGYKALARTSWMDYEAETGEYETIKYPDLSYYLDAIVVDNDDDKKEGASSNGNNKKVEYKERQIPIKKTIAKVARATNSFAWEEQYDASQEETTLFDIPCGVLIDSLGLEQREYDGSYYDKRGELAVFYNKDGKKFDSSHRLLIRKKILDEFLNKNELVMFWTCLGEKNFIMQEMREQEWSEWGGLMHYSDGTAIGAINQYEKEK